MYGSNIYCEIPKIIFEIPHKISYSYTENYGFIESWL